jgi:hypothetical protein
MPLYNIEHTLLHKASKLYIATTNSSCSCLCSGASPAVLLYLLAHPDTMFGCASVQIMGGNEYAVEDLLGFQLLARRGREYRCLHAECAVGLAALTMTPQSRARMAVNGAIPAMGQLLQLYTATSDASTSMRGARAVNAVQSIMVCLRNLTAAAATHVPMCTHCLPGIAAVAATAKSTSSSSTAVYDTAVAAAALALQVLSNLSRSRVQGVRLAIYKVQLRQQGSGKQLHLLNARKQQQQPQTDDDVSVSIEAILQRVRSASSSSTSVTTMCLADNDSLLGEGICANDGAVEPVAALNCSLDTAAIQKRLRTAPVHLWGALAQQLEQELAEHTASATAAARPHSSSSSSKRLTQHKNSSSSCGSSALQELCATLSRPSVTSAAPRQWQLRSVQTSLGERALTAALPLAVRLEQERVTRRCNGRTLNGRTNGRVAGRVSSSHAKSCSTGSNSTVIAAAAAAAVAAGESQSDVPAGVLNSTQSNSVSYSSGAIAHRMQRRSEEDCLLADRRPATAPASTTAQSTLLASVSDGHIRVVFGSSTAAARQHTATTTATRTNASSMNGITTGIAADSTTDGHGTVTRCATALATQRLMQDSVLQATHLHTAQTATTAATTHAGSSLKAYPSTNNPDPWSPSLLYRYTSDPVTSACPHETLVLDPTLSQSKFGFGKKPTQQQQQQQHHNNTLSSSSSVDSYSSARFRESDAAEHRRAAATVRLSRFEHTPGSRICEASHTEHVVGLDGRVYHHHCSTDLLSFPPGHPGAYPITAAPQTLRYMQLPLPPPQRALKPAAGALQGGSSGSSSGSSGGSGAGGTSEELLLAAGGAQPGDAVPDAPQCTAHSMVEVQRWRVTTAYCNCSVRTVSTSFNWRSAVNHLTH